MTTPLADNQDEIRRVAEAPAGARAQPARDLLPLVYDELRRLAARRLAREVPGQTLQATALVHEVYLRLAAGDPDRAWQGRGHFFAAAAEAMRRILVENARRRHQLKRGGNRTRVDLAAAAEPFAPETDEDLLALDEALGKLAEREPVKAELVQLRVFSGLSLAETAEILGLSTSTADRYWAYARAWLVVEIAGSDVTGPGQSRQ